MLRGTRYANVGRKETKKEKRLCIHPINHTRDLKGAFTTLNNEMREDEKFFLNYFDMSNASFVSTLLKLHPGVEGFISDVTPDGCEESILFRNPAMGMMSNMNIQI
ncbi:hypothetical protein PR048_002663 [Dryococelus australis]|uniref:Uncharacterized protein n=1 Tax=Dryococelus australis TaxID=614101 RepID=A0ABQ9IKV7_9NEOP|nr:hypothetical protein PR048_002663 [Dryococelus australis]